MRYFFLFLFAFSLYAQSSSTGITVEKTPVVKPNELDIKKEKPFEDVELDQEFYNHFFMVSPKQFEKGEQDKKKKLHANLIKIFKKEIAKRDRSATKEILREISSTTAKYKRILEDSDLLRQIKKEKLKHIKFMEYMYIIKYKKYMALIIFYLNPEIHLQDPSQIEFFMTKEIEPSIDFE